MLGFFCQSFGFVYKYIFKHRSQKQLEDALNEGISAAASASAMKDGGGGGEEGGRGWLFVQVRKNNIRDQT